jgi:D-alanyl-D-alanine carboxypeptidase
MNQFGALATTLLCVVLISESVCGDQVDQYIETEMAQRRIPGVALRIIKSGKSVKTGTYGLAQIELNVPVKAETVFEIGSVTKQFTAAAILLLAQDGKLAVEDKLSRHLKVIPDHWTNITIRHLLTHTSGVKSYTGLDGFELTKRLTQDQFIKAIGTHALEFQPGDSWKYSNSGYNLLGYVIENVSGRKYLEFLRDRILEPLGMTQTADRFPGTLITNRAAGYEQKRQLHINRDYDLTDVFAAGALISSIGDLEKWNAALDGESLLNATSKEQMWTAFRLNNGEMTQYGFGWRVDTLAGRKNIGHGGSTSGFSASLQRFPEDKLTIILLSNTDEQVATTMARKLATFYMAEAAGEAGD